MRFGYSPFDLHFMLLNGGCLRYAIVIAVQSLALQPLSGKVRDRACEVVLLAV